MDSDTTMKYFLCKLIPPRGTFNVDMTEAEARVMKEHAAYWADQANRGTAIAVGPVLDPTGVWGVSICELRDEDSIEALTGNDPVVKQGLGFRVEVYPMPRIILRGK